MRNSLPQVPGFKENLPKGKLKAVLCNFGKLIQKILVSKEHTETTALLSFTCLHTVKSYIFMTEDGISEIP